MLRKRIRIVSSVPSVINAAAATEAIAVVAVVERCAAELAACMRCAALCVVYFVWGQCRRRELDTAEEHGFMVVVEFGDFVMHAAVMLVCLSKTQATKGTYFMDRSSSTAGKSASSNGG